MFKYQIYVLLLVSCSLVYTTNVVAQLSIDSKYLQAILYLKTDKSTNKLTKLTFNDYYEYNLKETDYDKYNKDEFVKFNVLGRIEHFKIGRFEEQLKKINHDIDKKLIRDIQLYDSLYYFSPYKVPFLDEVIKKNDSKIYLTFSKPINNYIVAEIMLNPHKNPYHQPTDMYWKFGKHILLIFFFDSNGMIKNVVKRVGHY